MAIYYDNRSIGIGFSEENYVENNMNNIQEIIKKAFKFKEVSLTGLFEKNQIGKNYIDFHSGQGNKMIIKLQESDKHCEILKFKSKNGAVVRQLVKELNEDNEEVFIFYPSGGSQGSSNVICYFYEVGLALDNGHCYRWQEGNINKNLHDNTYGIYKYQTRNERPQPAQKLGENAYIIQMKDYCFANKDGYCISFNKNPTETAKEGNFIYQNLGVLYGYTNDIEERKTNKIWGTGLEPILLYTNNNINSNADNLEIRYDSINKILKINKQEFSIDQGALIVLGRRCQSTELEQGLRLIIDNVRTLYQNNSLSKFKMFPNETSKVTKQVLVHGYGYFQWTPFLWINPGCVSWISLNSGCHTVTPYINLSQMVVPVADILINTTLTYYGFQTRISDYLSNLPLKLSLNNELPQSSKQSSYQTWWTEQKENYKITWDFGQLSNEQYNLSDSEYVYNDKVFANPSDTSSILGLESVYNIGSIRFWTVSKFDAYKREESIPYGYGTSSGQSSMKTSDGKIIINFKTYKTCKIDNITPELSTAVSWGLSLAQSPQKYSFIKLIGTMNSSANGLFPKKINLVNTPSQAISDSGISGIGEVDYYQTSTTANVTYRAGGSAFIQNNNKIQNSYWIIWVPYTKWKRVDITLEQGSSYDNMYGYIGTQIIDTTNWKHYYVDFPNDYKVFSYNFTALNTDHSTFLTTINQNQSKITLSVYYLEN